MLFLLFKIGDGSYALEGRQVVEILPLVQHQEIPHAPPAVVGLFNYHGLSVPLIDLTQLALNRPSLAKMSTRIILTEIRGRSAEMHLVGLIAEHVLDTVSFAESAFVASGVNPGDAPYIGAVTIDQERIIQKIEIERLLPIELREQLFHGLVGINA